jgi:LmbE family N-acetylglucosaminyl deacetylase
VVELAKVQRVLAVGAHPDDCELLCGGTLALFAASQVSVTICAVARGDKGSRQVPPEEFAALRRSEATRSAGVIVAEFVCLDAADGDVAATSGLRRRLLDTIRHARPHLILTHWPDDYHADHRETAELVTDCSWFAASPGHRTQLAALDEPVPVFYLDTIAGLSFEPTEYVDITGVWAKKEEMLRCHVSQLGPAAQHGEGDLIALARDLARFRGRQCGVEFAEGFRPCLKWKRIRPARLLP